MSVKKQKIVKRSERLSFMDTTGDGASFARMTKFTSLK